MFNLTPFFFFYCLKQLSISAEFSHEHSAGEGKFVSHTRSYFLILLPSAPPKLLDSNVDKRFGLVFFFSFSRSVH